MSRRVLFVVVCLLGLAPVVMAAQAQYTSGSYNYNLKTNSSGGTCTVTQLSDGSVDIDCDDGAGNRSVGNSVTGCVRTYGEGQCVVIPGPSHTLATMDLSCGPDVYRLTTGDNSGSCSSTTSGGVKSGNCNGGSNSASANCNDGCTGSTGAGSCTKVKP